jgi:hypothetical protein
MSAATMTFEIPPIVQRYREAMAEEARRRKEREHLEALQREIQEAEDYFGIERPDPRVQIRAMLSEGVDWRKISAELGVSRNSVLRERERLQKAQAEF